MIIEVSFFPFKAKAQNYAFFYCTPHLRQKYFLPKVIFRNKDCKILLISMVLENPRYLRLKTIFHCEILFFGFLEKNGIFVFL